MFRLNTTEEYYVNSEVKYGILPLPKYDQSQDNYRSAPQGEYSCMCIFDNIGDERKNRAGTTLEYMGYYTYHKIRPVLFEKLYKYRYLSDSYSGQVFDMVIDSIEFDFGYMYTENIGSPTAKIREFIWSDGSDLGSTLETVSQNSTTKLNNLLKDFYNN